MTIENAPSDNDDGVSETNNDVCRNTINSAVTAKTLLGIFEEVEPPFVSVEMALERLPNHVEGDDVRKKFETLVAAGWMEKKSAKDGDGYLTIYWVPRYSAASGD